jgi:hypothetical protein
MLLALHSQQQQKKFNKKVWKMTFCFSGHTLARVYLMCTQAGMSFCKQCGSVVVDKQLHQVCCLASKNAMKVQTF